MNLRIIIALLLVNLTAGTAFAQYFGSIADPDLPLISPDIRQQLDRNDFGFSESEVVLINQLLVGFQVNVDALLQQRAEISKQSWKVTQRYTALGPGGDEAHQAERKKVMAELQAFTPRHCRVAEQVIELKKVVTADIRNVLTESNQLIWDRVGRDTRRRQTIDRNYRFIAEGVDLIGILRKITEIPVNAEVLLEQYAQELDPLLITRNDHFLRQLQELYADTTPGSLDPRFQDWRDSALNRKESRQIEAEIQEIRRTERIQSMRPTRGLQLRIREINRRYHDLLMPLLEEQIRPAYLKLFRKRAYQLYPIFRDLEADRFLVAILADDDIDEIKRKQITRLRAVDYIPHRDELNLALADAYERWELRWEERILKTLDPSYEDRIRRRHQRRRALQERIVKQVVQLLGAEALEKHQVPITIKDKPRF